MDVRFLERCHVVWTILRGAGASTVDEIVAAAHRHPCEFKGLSPAFVVTATEITGKQVMEALAFFRKCGWIYEPYDGRHQLRIEFDPKARLRERIRILKELVNELDPIDLDDDADHEKLVEDLVLRPRPRRWASVRLA